MSKRPKFWQRRKFENGCSQMTKKSFLYADQCHRARVIAAAKGSVDQQTIGTKHENGTQCHYQNPTV